MSGCEWIRVNAIDRLGFYPLCIHSSFDEIEYVYSQSQSIAFNRNHSQSFEWLRLGFFPLAENTV